MLCGQSNDYSKRQAHCESVICPKLSELILWLQTTAGGSPKLAMAVARCDDAQPIAWKKATNKPYELAPSVPRVVVDQLGFGVFSLAHVRIRPGYILHFLSVWRARIIGIARKRPVVVCRVSFRAGLADARMHLLVEASWKMASTPNHSLAERLSP